jgi:ELWxxDGT repeat protein
MKKNYPCTPAAVRLKKMAFAAALCIALIAPFGSNAQLELLKDINDYPVPDYDPYAWLKPAATKVYFHRGTELWVTSGGTTTLVRSFTMIKEPVVVGDVAYFAANDGSGTGLWRSDGTNAGTISIAGGDPLYITVVSPTLIFFSANTTTGRELWKTNGTAAGTMLVKDIIRGAGHSNPRDLEAVNNKVFFTANDGQHGYELWSSDGTAAGTILVKDIRPQTSVGASSNPEFLTNVNGTLYFRANDYVTGIELWRSDGTAAGTYRVKDIRPGTTSGDVENLINVNGTLLFTANDGIHGDELWKTNGTEAGTVLVKDLNPGSGGSNNTSPWNSPMGNFTNVNSILYFTAGKGYTDQFIVRSDGTEGGTFVVTRTEPVGMNRLTPRFTYLNGSVYFFNSLERDQFALYRIDAANAVHHVMPLTIPEDYYAQFYPEMTTFGGSFYLTTYSSTGWKVMKLESSGSFVIINEAPNPSSDSNPHNFTRVGNLMYFFTDAYWPGAPELWRTDGTQAGTIRIAEVGQSNNGIAVVGDKVFFNYYNSLYVTTGTPESNVNLINFQDYDYQVRNLTNVNGIVYFHNSKGEVWKTDGTPAGTVKVRTLSNVQNITNVNGKAFILNETATGALELWRTNSTGLLLVKTIRTNTATKAHNQLTAAAGNWFYFVANDGIHGNEVWRSDGTAFGTQMTIDLNTTDPLLWSLENDIKSFSVLQGKLYVSALTNDGWKMYSMFKNYAPVDLGNMPPVQQTIADEYSPYRLYLFAYRTPEDPHLQLYLYDLLGGSQFVYLSDVGVGTVSHAYVGGLLYFSTEYYPVPKQVTSCGIIDIPTGTNRVWPMASLGTDLIFADNQGGVGVEPHIYRNIAAISENCQGASDARIATTESVFTPYPNPYTTEFTMRIEGNEGEQAEVAVFNGSGMPVETFRNIDANFDYTNVGATWPKGIYVVKVNRGGVVTTHRLVKK